MSDPEVKYVEDSNGAASTLPAQARAVVIGAGIVGNSLAYHLARLGWTDLALLDQLGPCLSDPDANVAGFHLYTFNELDGTERWRRQTLERLAG